MLTELPVLRKETGTFVHCDRCDAVIKADIVLPHWRPPFGSNPEIHLKCPNLALGKCVSNVR
jgi:hypothetical protein